MVEIIRELPFEMDRCDAASDKIRFRQAGKGNYRNLRAEEILLLEEKGNRAEAWDKVLVSDPFEPTLVENCRFRGLVRLGVLEKCFLRSGDLTLPCGLYNSRIVSCDLGDRIALHDVGYLSGYIVAEGSLLFKIDEMTASAKRPFGGGVTVETANEKGTRGIRSFPGILPGDGWLWAKFRDKPVFRESFDRWTEEILAQGAGHFGTVGRGCVIKSCRAIKDVIFGEASHVSGANRLERLTLDGTAEQPVVIGEGVQLCDGLIQRGAEISRGVTAESFILGEESCLKYGARFMNSFLGANSTISCCEVLNSLLFPFHEQHHNNSFLIASVLQGQSNLAAGATIGSNHNSRGADGEIVAARGFWPGLNVSLKHNSRFAPYTLISKGNYPAELNIPLPFSLLSRDESRDMIRLMPAYWFHYNMYALARNSGKFRRRDRRINPRQELEFHFLAPDSMEAVREGRRRLIEWCGAEKLADPKWDPEEIIIKKHNIEKGRRSICVVRPGRAYRTYDKLMGYYFVLNLLENREDFSSLNALNEVLKGSQTDKWFNLGGQLISRKQLNSLEEKIGSRQIDSWEDLHRHYEELSRNYAREKLRHSGACWFERSGKKSLNGDDLQELLNEAIKTGKELFNVTLSSREKDYTDSFRRITFDTDGERDAVLGRLEDDSFIMTQKEELDLLTIGCEKLLQTIGG